MNEFRVKLVGVKECVSKLNRMGVHIRKTHARNAVSASGGVFRRAVEASVPQESGTLKRHIRTRVNVNRRGDWFAAVGARRKVKVRGEASKSSIKQAVTYRRDGAARRITQRRADAVRKAGGRVDYRSPSRYIHLANAGARPHQATTAKRAMVTAGGDWIGKTARLYARGRLFMSRAARSAAPAAASAAIRQLEKAIKQEVAKNG